MWPFKHKKIYECVPLEKCICGNFEYHWLHFPTLVNCTKCGSVYRINNYTQVPDDPIEKPVANCRVIEFK